MPKIGEIIKGKQIGKNDNRKYIWHACESCGRERWVVLARIKHNGGEPDNKQCGQCGRYQGRGFRVQKSDGYKLVYLDSNNDFFRPMAILRGKYVMEHRFIMAKHLNRCLLSWEIVHHKNGIRDDNRYENLELVGVGKHNTRLHQELKRQAILISRLEATIVIQGARLTLLEAELTRQSLSPLGIIS